MAPLQASVAVPVGGIDCGGPDPEPLLDLHKDVSQADVAPGGTFDYTLTVPNRGPCTLKNVVVTDVVEAPAGTTVTAVPTPASNDNKTLVWNAGDIAPKGTATFTLTVKVPDDAKDGYVFNDDLKAEGICDGKPVTNKVSLPYPKVSTSFTGPCDLGQSNKSASHLEVTPGQAFNYFVHVFNTGAKPCTNVDVSDALDDRLEFVACTAGCTNTGQDVKWAGQTIPSGSGATLTVTVRVRDDAKGRLANAAIITTPDDPDTPVTVTHDGPQITDDPVVAPPNPPKMITSPDKPTPPEPALPRTGGDVPLALIAGLGVVGLAGLGVRRRILG